MPIYNCITCNKSFELKTDYTRHINKKFKCKANDNNIDESFIMKENDLYKCIKCNKIFNYKSQYVRHINNKFSCIENNNEINEQDMNNEENIIQNEKKHKCLSCQKSFTTIRSLNRHITDFCNNPPLENNDLLEIISVLKNELTEKKNKNKVQNTPSNGNVDINGNNNNAINGNNNNANSNNVINNITINAYGKEDLSHITDNDYKTLFAKCNSLIPMLIELIHFNENKPENTNVYISNIKSSHVNVYDGKKWILKNKNELIDDIYDNKCIIIIDKFDDMKELLNKNTIELFSKFVKKHETKIMKKNMADKIELILYNNRDLIKQK
jgi:uncharacterized C2H2 Zn-finger protein